MPTLVFLVPGILGSKLQLGGEVVWPGPLSGFLFGYKQMAQLMSAALEPTDVIRSYWGVQQYQGLIDDLEGFGFHEHGTPPTLFVFPYDWRRGNEEAAGRLADQIDTAVAQHGGDAEVTLIGHSMGGLVSRYYLESGKFTGRPGFSSVRMLVTLATPHRGAPVALQRILGFDPVLWLNRSQARELANDSRFPAVYQLLPPPGEPFLWDLGVTAGFGALDAYDAATGTALGLNGPNIASARAFHTALDLAKRPPGVRYFCFSGTRMRTTTLVRYRQGGGTRELRPTEVDSSGDGTVPFWSSTMTGLQSLSVAGEHSVIYKTRELRRTLGAILGAIDPGVVALPTPLGEVEVAVRDRVAEPGALVFVSLGMEGGVTDLKGDLRVEEATLSEAGAPPVFVPTGTSYPVSYSGSTVLTIGLMVPAPDKPGVYRLAFYHGGAAGPAGADELFVQQPPA
jgi:pimeloyl-ACP methyl ester carboxylesterase